MPRNRMIRPEFWNDEKLGEEPESVMLTYIGTWTFSDDYGVVKGNRVFLKNSIFPYKHQLRIEVFTKWLEALEGQEKLIPFTIRGERFYFIRTFRLYQSVEKPSKTRNCTEEELRSCLETEGYKEIETNRWEKVSECSGSTTRLLPDEEKRSISVSKVNRAKALVIASNDDPAGSALKKEYQDLLKQLEGKDRLTIWNSVKDFIRIKKPLFIEPYFDAWNVFAINIRLIKEPQKITDNRRKKFNTRIMESDFDFLKILEKIQLSKFLKGDNDRGWKVSIEFILESQEKYTKILEGKYDHL